MTRAERTLAVAMDVAETLAKHNVPCAVIGAVALAVHGYELDVLELFDRNPTLDRKDLETVCKDLGLDSELRKVLGA